YQFFIIPAIVSVILIWGWPALTGNLNGHINSSILPYPDDMKRTIDYLHEHNVGNIGRIFWYPAQSGDLLYSTVPQLSTTTSPTLSMNHYEINYLEYLIGNKDNY